MMVDTDTGSSSIQDEDDTDHVQVGEHYLPSLLPLKSIIQTLVSGPPGALEELLCAVLLSLPSFSSSVQLVEELEETLNHAHSQTGGDDVNAVEGRVAWILHTWISHSAATVDFSVGDSLRSAEDILERLLELDKPALSSVCNKAKRELKSVMDKMVRLQPLLSLIPDHRPRSLSEAPPDEHTHTHTHTHTPIHTQSLPNSSTLAPSNPYTHTHVPSAYTRTNRVESFDSVALTSARNSRGNSMDLSDPSQRPTPRSLVDELGLPFDSPISPTVSHIDVMSILNSAVPSSQLEVFPVVRLVPYDSLARVLTIIDYEECLLKVRPREFVGLAWMCKHKKHLHPDLQGAKNVCSWISNTNQRVSWIAHQIIAHGTAVGPANEAIEYFIRVCRSCLRRNNLCAAFEVSMALSLPAVQRLDAWCNVAYDKKQLFQQMSSMVSPMNNYQSYRRALANVRTSPHIPALPIMVRDVTAMEHSESWLKRGKINIRKMMNMYQLVNAFLLPQKNSYTVHIHTDEEVSSTVPQTQIQALISRIRNVESISSKETLGPFILHTDLKLLQLIQGGIQTANPNVDSLWHASMNINEAETNRLVNKLVKVGLL